MKYQRIATQLMLIKSMKCGLWMWLGRSKRLFEVIPNIQVIISVTFSKREAASIISQNKRENYRNSLQNNGYKV